MIKQGGGSIVNVSSGTALFGSPSISSYGPAKAAMINFSQHLAITYGPQGIRANTLTPARMLTEKKYEMLANNPAAVRTQKFVYPMGSPALPEQVAEVMLFLASDESAAITGHNLIADAGNAAYSPGGMIGRLERDLRVQLEAQGSEWLKSEL